MNRTLIAGFLSLPITFVLFFIMANLINQGNKLGESSDTENFIEFLRTTEIKTVETRKRSLPEKPPEPKVPPQMPKTNINQDISPQSPKMAMNTPMLTSPLNFGSGPYLGGATGGGSQGQGNSNVIPLVRIEPQYPRKAALTGSEGWVQLKFDVTETGAVTDVEIIKSKPRRVFDQAAKRALYKWKYRPKVIDGKPQKQKDLMVQLDFKLRK